MGWIATNNDHFPWQCHWIKYSEQEGGLSGKPLQYKSTAIIKRLHEELQGRIPIIGCGGIDSVSDAQAKMNVGATLLQIYSGLIYHGPKLVAELIRNIK